MSKTIKRSSSAKKEITQVEPEVIEPMSFETPSRPLLSVRNIIFVIILVAILGVWKFKGMFVAAMVNGQPVTRMELNDAMSKRYGQQTLDGIINEKLILQAIQSKGIKVTDSEIASKTKEIEDRLKGTISLKDALAAQGMTEDTFKKQMEVQIAVDKYFDKDASVSSAEIESYISTNSASFENATDPAKLKEDVKGILRQQKINDLFQAWFDSVKKDSKVEKFI